MNAGWHVYYAGVGAGQLHCSTSRFDLTFVVLGCILGVGERGYAMAKRLRSRRAFCDCNSGVGDKDGFRVITS